MTKEILMCAGVCAGVCAHAGVWPKQGDDVLAGMKKEIPMCARVLKGILMRARVCWQTG